ncbi:MAG: tetratricopeptide repeat protein [Planctomycetota bacterium]
MHATIRSRPFRLLAVVTALAAMFACDRTPTPGPGQAGAANTVNTTTPPPGEDGTSGPGEEASASMLQPQQERDIIGLIRQGRFGPARVRLRRHLDQFPRDGRAEFLFGLTYHRERFYGKARPHFERARERSPNDELIDYFLGWCLYYLGEPEEARAAFERHLARTPLAGDTHFALGVIALEEDRLDEAEAMFRRAIGLQTGQPGREREVAKARGRLADVFIQRGDLESARTELLAAIDLYADHYELHYKLYRVLMRLGDEDGAARAEQEFLAAQRRVPPGTRVPE